MRHTAERRGVRCLPFAAAYEQGEAPVLGVEIDEAIAAKNDTQCYLR